jgi:hypothetical protein
MMTLWHSGEISSKKLLLRSQPAGRAFGGAHETREAEKHERKVQYFKRH